MSDGLGVLKAVPPYVLGRFVFVVGLVTGHFPCV